MATILREGEYFGRLHTKYTDPSFTCCTTVYEDHAEIQKHYHENDYVSVLIMGNYFEETKNQNEALETGSVIFRPALYDHANRFFKSESICFNIEFKQDWQHSLDFKFKLPGTTSIYKPGTFHSLYKIFYYWSIDQRFTSELIIDWLMEIKDQPKIPSHLPWMDKVFKIIENEFHEHHTINAVANRIYVHPIYLARAFKEKTGYTLGEYQLKTKLKKAITLLFNSRLPINEIAFRTGFYDSPHFIKTFSTMYGVSPHKFRGALKG